MIGATPLTRAKSKMNWVGARPANLSRPSVKLWNGIWSIRSGWLQYRKNIKPKSLQQFWFRLEAIQAFGKRCLPERRPTGFSSSLLYTCMKPRLVLISEWNLNFHCRTQPGNDPGHYQHHRHNTQPYFIHGPF